MLSRLPFIPAPHIFLLPAQVFPRLVDGGGTRHPSPRLSCESKELGRHTPSTPGRRPGSSSTQARHSSRQERALACSRTGRCSTRLQMIRSPPPLFQEVDVVQLGGFVSPGLADPVVHLPHPVDHLVWPLPCRQELALGRGDEYQYQVSRQKGSVVGLPCCRPCCRLGLSEVAPDDRPCALCHAVPHLLHVVQHGPVWRRLALPCLLGKV